MHIPDSAMGPAGSVVAYTMMAPIWVVASRRCKAALQDKSIAFTGVCAAFSFVLMMFNVPAPGGTTVHPVGGGLMAVVAGPWPAVIGMSITLAVQALLFGDGGLTTFGANCLAMAVTQPLVTALVCRLIAGRSPTTLRRSVAAGIGAYVGLNAAALLVAIMLGIQPALYHDAAGHALYFPFNCRVTLPAILLPHLLIAGVAEALLTAAVVRAASRGSIPLALFPAIKPKRTPMLAAGSVLVACIAIAPIGLLASGDAWGEWSAEDMKSRIGYEPARMKLVDSHAWKGWSALSDYASGWGARGYVLSAIIGVAAVGGCMVLLLKTGRNRNEADSMPVQTVNEGTMPDWLMVKPVVAFPDNTDRGGSRGRALRRSMRTITSHAADSLRVEGSALQNGLFQRADARLKVVCVLGLVVATTLIHQPAILISAAFVQALLAIQSRIGVVAFLRRTWLAAPVFVAGIAIPAALNIATPGPALLRISREPDLTFTVPGAILAATWIIRTGVCIGFVGLLVATTRRDHLFGALRRLGLPARWLSILAVMYRSIISFTEVVADALTAVESRSVGKPHRGSEQTVAAGTTVALLEKSVQMTEDVRLAMLARGWRPGADS